MQLNHTFWKPIEQIPGKLAESIYLALEHILWPYASRFILISSVTAAHTVHTHRAVQDCFSYHKKNPPKQNHILVLKYYIDFISLFTNAYFTTINDSRTTCHSPNAIKVSKEHIPAYSICTVNHPNRASQPQDEVHASSYYSRRTSDPERPWKIV